MTRTITDRVFDLVDRDPRLCIEEVGATDDGSPILSMIDLDTGDHYHLTLTRV